MLVPFSYGYSMVQSAMSAMDQNSRLLPVDVSEIGTQITAAVATTEAAAAPAVPAVPAVPAAVPAVENVGNHGTATSYRSFSSLKHHKSIFFLSQGPII